MGPTLTPQNTQSAPHATVHAVPCLQPNHKILFTAQTTHIPNPSTSSGTHIAWTFHSVESRLAAHITQIIRHKPRDCKRSPQATIVEADNRDSTPPMLHHMPASSMTYLMSSPQICLRVYSPGIPAHKPHNANRYHTFKLPPLHSTHPDSPKLPIIHRPAPLPTNAFHVSHYPDPGFWSVMSLHNSRFTFHRPWIPGCRALPHFKFHSSCILDCLALPHSTLHRCCISGCRGLPQSTFHRSWIPGCCAPPRLTVHISRISDCRALPRFTFHRS